MFRLTQPCSSPMWIPVTSLDHTGLHFISPRTTREKFLSLTGCRRAIIQERLLVFCAIILTVGFLILALQSVNSKVCGHYCLYFALFRSRQVSMSTIVHRFSSNKRRNDLLVKRFIEKHFRRLSLPKYHTDVKKQSATAQHNAQ